MRAHRPAYCADRTNLENSIKGLTSLSSSSGVSGLKTQVTAVVNDATKLVSSAKGDFPSQTSAITSSVDTLKSSVSGLTAQPLRRPDRNDHHGRSQRGDLGPELRGARAPPSADSAIG